MSFNPQEHLIKLPKRVKNQDTGEWITIKEDYLEVKWRLCWFRDRYPHGKIVTEEVCVDLDRVVTIESTSYGKTNTKTGTGYARYRTRVEDGEGGVSTGYGTENAAEFADFCERAETRSIGRALAGLGIGTQFIGQEMTEMDHIVDSPVGSGTPGVSDTVSAHLDAAVKQHVVDTSQAPVEPPASSRQAAPTPGRAKPPPKGQEDKPIEKLNHEDAYVACVQELRRLAGPSDVEQVPYIQEAFGAAIDGAPKMYQLGKTPLQHGLRRLREMRTDHPPAEEDIPHHPQPQTTMEGIHAPPESTIVDGSIQGDGREPDRQPRCPVASKTGVPCVYDALHHGPHEFGTIRPEDRPVILPESPLVVDGYITLSDTRMLERWSQQQGWGQVFASAVAANPRNIHGDVLVTEKQWRSIKKAVEAMVEMNAEASASQTAHAATAP